MPTVFPTAVSRSARLLFLEVACAVPIACAVPPALPAQDGVPAIAVEVPGGSRLRADVGDLLDLTDAREQKQKRNLDDILDVFLIGVDQDRPIRVEPLTADSPTRYRLVLPIKNRADFERRNLPPNGIPVNRLRGSRDTYRLGGRRGAAFDGYMRYYQVGGADYVAIVEEQKDLPTRLTPPGTLLTDPADDAAFLLTNSADGLDARRERVTTAKRELIGAMKPLDREGETREDFLLRRTAAGQQIESLGRYYAESERIYGHTKVAGRDAASELQYSALPGTPTAEAMTRLDTLTSRFAGVPHEADAAFASRLLLPLVPDQQAGAKQVLGALQTSRFAAADADPDATPEQKRARKDAWTAGVDLLGRIAEAGTFDGFTRLREVDGKTRAAGGLALGPDTPDPSVIIQRFADSRSGRTASLNIEQYGGHALHKLELDPSRLGKLSDLFGGSTVHFATGNDMLLYTGGEDGLNELKALVDAVAKPGEKDPAFVRIDGALSTGLKIARAVPLPEDATEFVELADRAFRQEPGRFHAAMAVQGTKARGESSAGEGVLRLAGKLLAKFAAEVL